MVLVHIFSSLGAVKSSSDGMRICPLLNVEDCLVTFLCIIFGVLYHRHLPHISFLPIKAFKGRHFRIKTYL